MKSGRRAEDLTRFISVADEIKAAPAVCDQTVINHVGCEVLWWDTAGTDVGRASEELIIFSLSLLWGRAGNMWTSSAQKPQVWRRSAAGRTTRTEHFLWPRLLLSAYLQTACSTGLLRIRINTMELGGFNAKRLPSVSRKWMFPPGHHSLSQWRSVWEPDLDLVLVHDRLRTSELFLSFQRNIINPTGAVTDGLMLPKTNCLLQSILITNRKQHWLLQPNNKN